MGRHQCRSILSTCEVMKLNWREVMFLYRVKQTTSRLRRDLTGWKRLFNPSCVPLGFQQAGFKDTQAQRERSPHMTSPFLWAKEARKYFNKQDYNVKEYQAYFSWWGHFPNYGVPGWTKLIPVCLFAQTSQPHRRRDSDLHHFHTV